MATTQPQGFRSLITVHMALFMGQVLFALVAFGVVFFGGGSAASLREYSSVLVIVVSVAGSGAYFLSSSVFQKKLGQIKIDQKSISEKVENYRSACISRWALLEFAAILSTILFLMTHNYIILTIAVILIGLFFKTKPSLEKAATELGISETEIQQLDKPVS